MLFAGTEKLHGTLYLEKRVCDANMAHEIPKRPHGAVADKSMLAAPATAVAAGTGASRCLIPRFPVALMLSVKRPLQTIYHTGYGV